MSKGGKELLIGEPHEIQRLYIHVNNDGREERFDERPLDRPVLTVDVLHVSWETITEQTYTYIRPCPQCGELCEKRPPGVGWTKSGRTSEGNSTVWRRSISWELVHAIS